MRMLVLGAGLQGSACAYDLLQQPGVERVTIADLEPDRIPAVLRPHVGKRLALLKLDVQDGAALRDAMGGHEAVQNAAPYYLDRKSTRLNSSHSQISYAVFCLKKKKQKNEIGGERDGDVRCRTDHWAV